MPGTILAVPMRTVQSAKDSVTKSTYDRVITWHSWTDQGKALLEMKFDATSQAVLMLILLVPKRCERRAGPLRGKSRRNYLESRCHSTGRAFPAT